MLSDVQDIIKSKEYKIRFGIATFEPPPFLPNFLIQFGEACPDCNVTVYPLKDISSSGLGGVDIDLILRDIDLDGPVRSFEAEWDTEYLYHNNKYAVIARKSLLVETYGDQWPTIEEKLIAEKDLQILQDLPFLSVRDKNNMYLHLLKKVFKCAGVDPNIKFQVDMNYLINEMCAKGVAAYFGPERLCKFKFDFFTKESDDMCMYTVEIPGIRHGLAISYKKEISLTSAQREFIEMCREIVNHY